jgi:flagellar biogenesis protein FliO
LVVVSVEGRRLLLGLTPTHVSLLTELDAAQRTSLGTAAAHAAALPATADATPEVRS